ncbi:hypothetical protein LTS15_010857 [Exophiala xenobiotica]|nr:hypothetical protein LTS15_010857 [Exophiala xenobiotica]
MDDVSLDNGTSATVQSHGSVNSHFLRWESYPESLPLFDGALYDADSIRRDLDDHSSRLFSTEVNLKVTDVVRTPECVTVTTPLQQSNAERHITGGRPALRIISIFRKQSLAPLQITKTLLLGILSFHNVQPCFVDMLLALRGGDQLAEKGHGLWAPLRLSETAYQICYSLRYIERNDHKQGARWSERQVGVYHRFGMNEEATMILLHASPETTLQKRIEALFPNRTSTNDHLARPLMLHVLVLDTYMNNWRWALNDYAQPFRQKEDQFLTAPLQHPSLSFRELQELRNVESKLIVASSILSATQSIIASLEACGRSLASAKGKGLPLRLTDGNDLADLASPEMQSLKALRIKCLGYANSVEVIKNRVNILIGLLADGLNQQSQQTAAKISDSTYTLTKKSVGDNAIVKVVTVITLIYLPVQGVATFFGMNLSALPADTNKIRFAQDWWLFLAVSVPLTVVTLGVLGIAMQLDQAKKGDRTPSGS